MIHSKDKTTEYIWWNSDVGKEQTIGNRKTKGSRAKNQWGPMANPRWPPLLQHTMVWVGGKRKREGSQIRRIRESIDMWRRKEEERTRRKEVRHVRHYLAHEKVHMPTSCGFISFTASMSKLGRIQLWAAISCNLTHGYNFK